MIDKVQETHLYKWLCEKNSEFLGQVNEAIRYAETMLPLVSKVFADYTVHGIRHSNIRAKRIIGFVYRIKIQYGELLFKMSHKNLIVKI